VQLSVIYYVDSLRSGYYAYGFYQKPCEEGMVQLQKTVELECQKILTNSKRFASNENDNKFPYSQFFYSLSMRRSTELYFLESLCLYPCAAVCA